MMNALMRLAALLMIVALLIGPVAAPVRAQAPLPDAADLDATVATAWFDLMLELIRQSPGYTPPVASRALGYAGVTLYEAVAPGIPNAQSLAGQLNGLERLPRALEGADYHWQLVANSAMAAISRRLFAGAGDPARTAIDGLETTLRKRYAPGVSPATVRRSIEYGRLVAATIFAWSRTDGGHEAYMLNFPVDYTPPAGPGFWVSTPPAHLRALQPYWGDNRPFALISNEECAPLPPPTYSTAPTSTLYIEAQEVYDTVRGLTPEQREIALYWSDDPSLTATPPGHSVAIATQILRKPGTSLARAAETYARLGIAVADSFIANWHIKYKYNQIRPITYIQRVIDPSWNWPRPTDPVITPPFPEYPSGHSTEAGSAAAVLTALFGDEYAFEDRSQERLGFASRAYPSFHAAAEEAAISRLYGGIHFRSGNEGGLAQGRCIGERVMTLEMIGADQP